MTDSHSQLKAYLQAERPWFWEWRSPSEISARVVQIRRTLRSDFPDHPAAFVLHREAKSFREAWVLANCASLLSIDSIKLSVDDPPDGYFQRSGQSVPAEVLEIIEPGRKRGLEYGPNAPSITMDPGENWVRRAKAIPGALIDGIKKKRAKVYPPSSELFVYLNIGEYGIAQNQIEEKIRSILAQPASPFATIHVQWKLKLYNSNGETIFDPNAQLESDEDDAELWDSIVDDAAAEKF